MEYIESLKNGTAQDVNIDDDGVSVISDTDSISSATKRRRIEKNGRNQNDECANCQVACIENQYLKEIKLN